jgi:hypothetical protein
MQASTISAANTEQSSSEVPIIITGAYTGGHCSTSTWHPVWIDTEQQTNASSHTSLTPQLTDAFGDVLPMHWYW